MHGDPASARRPRSGAGRTRCRAASARTACAPREVRPMNDRTWDQVERRPAPFAMETASLSRAVAELRAANDPPGVEEPDATDRGIGGSRARVASPDDLEAVRWVIREELRRCEIR